MLKPPIDNILGFWSVRDHLTRVLALAENAGMYVQSIRMSKSKLMALREHPGPEHPQVVGLSDTDLGVVFVYNGHTVRLVPSTGGPEEA